MGLSTLRLLSWNVNGLRAAHKKGFLPWLEVEGADVACIQETKAAPAQLPPELINVPGYHAYYEAGERAGYSGVALFSKHPPRGIRTTFGVKNLDVEGRIQIAEYDAFVLFNIYFPNGQSCPERLAYKMAFYDAFLKYVDGVSAAGKNVVICGDVNTAHKEIDLARPKENAKTSGFLPEERAWIDAFVSHGYVDTFRMFNDAGGNYTYWDQKTRARSRNVGWRIDYFFVNERFRDRVRDAFILPDVMGSDHCPIGITVAA